MGHSGKNRASVVQMWGSDQSKRPWWPANFALPDHTRRCEMALWVRVVTTTHIPPAGCSNDPDTDKPSPNSLRQNDLTELLKGDSADPHDLKVVLLLREYICRRFIARMRFDAVDAIRPYLQANWTHATSAANCLLRASATIVPANINRRHEGAVYPAPRRTKA